MKFYINTDENGRVKSYTSSNAKTNVIPDDQIDVTDLDLPSDFLVNLDKYIYENGSLRLETDVEKSARDFPDEDYWKRLRSDRNRLLAECDWTQAVDAPLTEQKKIEWQTYRTALRTLPDTTTDPRSPTWPQKPT